MNTKSQVQREYDMLMGEAVASSIVGEDDVLIDEVIVLSIIYTSRS